MKLRKKTFNFNCNSLKISCPFTLQECAKPHLPRVIIRTILELVAVVVVAITQAPLDLYAFYKLLYFSYFSPSPLANLNKVNQAAKI